MSGQREAGFAGSKLAKWLSIEPYRYQTDLQHSARHTSVLSPTNILINAVSSKSGGAVTYAVNLARQLADIGSPHRFIFYVPRALAKSLERTSSKIAVVGTSIG